MKQMSLVEIPAFVHEIVAAGCNIVAVGDIYVMDLDDMPESDRSLVEPRVATIISRYGTREHLVHEIADYLASIGRVQY